MLMMKPERVEQVVQHAHWYVLGGVGACILAAILPRDMKCGAVSGVILLSLGFHVGILRRWRVEPGLWMLSSFIGIWALAIFSYMLYSHLAGLHAPRKPNAITSWWIVDLAIATDVMWIQVRFLYTVTRLNWHIATTQTSAQANDHSAVKDVESNRIWLAVVPRVVVSVLLMMIVGTLAGVLAMVVTCGYLGLNIKYGALIGSIGGIYTGAITGIRSGIFGKAYARPSPSEQHVFRLTTIIGAALAGLLFLMVSIVRGNVPLIGLALVFVFGIFCGSVIGLMFGVIITSFHSGWSTVLSPLRKGGKDKGD